MTMKDGWNCIDIRHYDVPYGLSCENFCHSRDGISLRLDKWAQLVELLPLVHKRHPELACARCIKPINQEGWQASWHSAVVIAWDYL